MTAASTLSLDEAIAQHGEQSVREAVRHAWWRRGDLTYLLHEGREPEHPLVHRYVPEHLRPEEPRGQLHAIEAIEDAVRDGADTFVVKTGRQYGKSLLFAVVCAMACVRSVLEDAEPVRIPYAAPSGKQVDEFITPHFQLLQRHAPPELRPEHHTQKGHWVWPNGSKVVVGGCEDKAKAERLRGPRAHLAIVDEAGFIPIVDYVIESVLGWQLATTGGLMLMSSTPPVSMDHPFVTLWERARAQGYAFESTTPEAPHMSAELIDKAIRRCGGEQTIAWRREGLGELIADPDKTVLPEFVEHYDMIVREVERPEHYLPHVIGDGGHEDLAVYAFGYYDFKADLDVLEDEVVLRRARSDEHDAQVAAKERELWGDRPVHRRMVDAPPQTRHDLSRPEWGEDGSEGGRFWQGVSKPPSKLGSFNAGVNEARVRARRGRVAIHPRCKTIIAHSMAARWDLGRRGLERVKDSHGDPLHHFDGCAALVYFLRDLDRKANPYPRLPAHINEDDHFIHPRVYAEERRKRELFVPKSRRKRGRRR